VARGSRRTANRAFLARAVRHVVGSGVRQILDIGTGLPTSPNVHEIAREVAPDVRIAYVDNDPIVNTYADALPAGSFLVLSHATGDFAERADRSAAQAVYDSATATTNLRPRAGVERFFDGFELIEPGLAQAPFWRPDGPPPAGSEEIGFYGGVGIRTA
jgi:hypothetical protein